MELRDKRVVVIGGSSGPGLAVARAVSAQGGKVLIAGRSVDRLVRAKTEIGGKVGAYPLDLTKEQEVERFFARLGTLDHLVVATAGRAAGSFLDLPQAQAFFENRFWGAYRAVRHAAPRITAAGSVTLFSVLAAQRPFPGSSIEAAAGGAVEALCRALALELAPVRVNAVAPGFLEAPASVGREGEERRDFLAAAARLPAGRTGRPEDVAEAVLFLLCSPFVTGAVLPVDGGGRIA